jgi:hypothetical protein
VTCNTISLEQALAGVRAYNCGFYRGVSNTDLDSQARQQFASGLGVTLSEIREQVNFIGDDYGGAAGFQKALTLVPNIAEAIFTSRASFAKNASDAPHVLRGSVSRESLLVLYQPFVTAPLHGKRNWHVWATKFWHFLNPDAFPIEDSRVDIFFGLRGRDASVKKYEEFLCRYRRFVSERRDWVPRLQEADQGLAWCENKLWDKVFYEAAGQCS